MSGAEAVVLTIQVLQFNWQEGEKERKRERGKDGQQQVAEANVTAPAAMAYVPLVRFIGNYDSCYN